MTPDDGPARTFEQYTAEVYGWAYRVLGRHHDALDVVQDVYLKWNAQCTKEMPNSPRGWLRTVTLNRAIDMHRRQSRTAPEAAAEPRGDDPGVADRLDHELLRADVAAALDELTEAQRTVLVAKVYDGMTFAQAADENGLAVSTVKTHYLRALRRVRDRLQARWATETTEC